VRDWRVGDAAATLEQLLTGRDTQPQQAEQAVTSLEKTAAIRSSFGKRAKVGCREIESRFPLQINKLDASGYDRA
jgi:hypothetical protein